MASEHQNGPLKSVVIEGLAVLRIVKHCNDNLPAMSAGSLLGLDVNGVLEVTYAFPNPAPRQDADGNAERTEADELEGSDYQLEMMKMLRDVGVDNNCVGWYQSMYLGQMCNEAVVNIQYSYQSSEHISENSVVIMYDPIQSKKGTLVIKAYRLSDDYIEAKRNRSNQFIRPAKILQELPVLIRNGGHVSAFIRCLQDSHKAQLDCDFDPLSMAASESYMERHLELLGSWMADVIEEQYRIQQYARQVGKPRQDHIRWLHKRLQENQERRENGEDELSTRIEDANMKPVPDTPSRSEHLLMLGQLEKYCDQINDHVETTLSKLMVSAALN
jgi:translation initiation factor 3 subunit H